MIALIASIAAAAFQYRVARQSVQCADVTESELMPEVPTQKQSAAMAYIDAVYPAAIQDEFDITFVFFNAPNRGAEMACIDLDPLVFALGLNTAHSKFAIERAIHKSIAGFFDFAAGTRFEDYEWTDTSIVCDIDDWPCAVAEKAETYAVLMASSKTLGRANPFDAPGFAALATLMNRRLVAFNPAFGAAMKNAHMIRLLELP